MSTSMETELHPSLQPFSPAVQRWFTRVFGAPTPPQAQGWPSIAAGQHTLICAPTGSGKTLAAFLWCLDEIFRALLADEAPKGVHTLYISPLKALNYDIEHNLRAPLKGIRRAIRDQRQFTQEVRVAVRTGDTTSSQRAAMIRKPPHLLITTPESLFILLTSPRALPMLSTVRYIVVDEVHALCGNKRGVNLALSLERLVERCDSEPVRVGLSATLRPLDLAARFLGGARRQAGRLVPRPVTVVETGGRKELDLEVVAPVPDLGHLTKDSVWPDLHTLLLDWTRQHRSTLIFVGMRAQSERISRALNELAGSELTAAHHGSLGRNVRVELEQRLKEGRLPALISTGTLELGIDVGAIDLVAQVGSPHSVSSGLQRVGRAGHLLTKRSRGRLLSLYREDLVECTVVARLMLEGRLEALRPPQNALDVLAQHVVSAISVEPRTGADLLALFQQAAPYRELTEGPFSAVLGLLSGRYPADVARGLVAKLAWERTTDQLSPLPGASQLAVTAGGTIPDRGYYQLKMPDGTRLGELEEEFVFERSVGDVIAFGTGSWRIQSIDRQRVVVTPAPGRPAVVPFWKGGIFGRDPELSVAIGAFRRELYQRVDDPAAADAWLRREYPVDGWAAANLVRYFGEQKRRGVALGSDRAVVVEAFNDELGDHLLLVHSSFGNRLNTPWALALRRHLRLRLGIDPQVISDDNGILFRVPAGQSPPPLDLLDAVHADQIEEMVTRELPGTAMYGTLFRQNAARFLVLGTLGHGRRTPLWLQRLRAKDLQDATAGNPEFPVRLETFRECLQDVMDLPRLGDLLQQIERGAIQVVVQQTDRPSPVASGLLNRFIGQYMYEYDEPRAERVLHRLQLDRALLDQILGRDDLSDLLLPEAIDELEQQWQGRSERSRARDPSELLATVYRLVLLPEQEIADHCSCSEQADAQALILALLEDRRLSRFSLDGETERWWLCATEDLPLLALAHQPRTLRIDPRRKQSLEAPDLPASPEQARLSLLARLLDQMGPTSVEGIQRRCDLHRDQLVDALDQLRQQGRLRQGKFRLTRSAPKGREDPEFRADRTEAPQVCTPFNLEQIRRRSVAHARRQVEPVEPHLLQRFIIEHQLVGGGAAGRSGLDAVLELLSVRAMPAEIVERDVLAERIAEYQPGWLDELVTRGDLLWTGNGTGWIRLLLRQDLELLPAPEVVADAAVRGVQSALAQRGASFIGDLVSESELLIAELKRALWQLTWAGHATNDRFESLRRGLATSFEPPSAERAGQGPRINPLTGQPSSISPRRRSGRRGRERLDGKLDGDPWAGRWSLLPDAGADSNGSIEDQVWLLVRRYGLVARELVQLEEGISWSNLYPVLRQLELRGDLRRGLFVQGLGAAQFGPIETVDRLRALRDAGPGDPALLNACDPALVAPALGMPLPCPGPLARRPSTYAVIQDGRVVLVAESRGKRLYLEPNERAGDWIELLTTKLLKRGQRAVRVEQLNGEPALGSGLRNLLEVQGFRPDGKAMERRRYG